MFQRAGHLRNSRTTAQRPLPQSATSTAQRARARRRLGPRRGTQALAPTRVAQVSLLCGTSFFLFFFWPCPQQPLHLSNDDRSWCELDVHACFNSCSDIINNYKKYTCDEYKFLLIEANSMCKTRAGFWKKAESVMWEYQGQIHVRRVPAQPASAMRR